MGSKEVIDNKNECQICSHDIVVKVANWYYNYKYNSAYCLWCNKHFSEAFGLFDHKFKNIIYAEEFARKHDFSDTEIVEFAKKRYEELSCENPEFTDKEISKIINSEIDNNVITLKLKKDNSKI